MSKHTFLKKKQKAGWGHSIIFYRRSFVSFAWKMNMLLAFPTKRHTLYLAIKWERKKWQQGPLHFFFNEKITYSFNQTINWRLRSLGIFTLLIQAVFSDWKLGKRWPLEPKMKELRVLDYIYCLIQEPE